MDRSSSDAITKRRLVLLGSLSNLTLEGLGDRWRMLCMRDKWLAIPSFPRTVGEVLLSSPHRQRGGAPSGNRRRSRLCTKRQCKPEMQRDCDPVEKGTRPPLAVE
jgi:hypothetical protein